MDDTPVQNTLAHSQFTSLNQKQFWPKVKHLLAFLRNSALRAFLSFLFITRLHLNLLLCDIAVPSCPPAHHYMPLSRSKRGIGHFDFVGFQV